MKILLIDDDDSIRQFIITVLENLLSEVDVIECTNANLGIKILESDPYFELIICDFNMEGGNGDQMYLHLTQRGYEIPFIMHTQKDLSYLKKEQVDLKGENNHFYIQKGLDAPGFRNAIATLPFLKDSQYIPVQESEYRKVRIFYFWRFSKTLCDIYLRLGDEKFVKIIHKDDHYGPEMINKYVDKKQKYLYIKKEDYTNFSATLAQTPFLQFDDSVSKESKVLRTNAIIQQMAISSGVTPEVVAMSKESIQMVIEEVKGKKDIWELLENLKDRMDYGYDHANLLCYFTCALCDKLGWTTRRSKEKLCFASLFHDITLLNPNLAMIQDHQGEELSTYNNEEKQTYLSHPFEAAEMVESASNVYPQVDQIIQMHHEKVDGTGFPKGIDYTKIPPLPSLFILAHDFVSRLYQNQFNEEAKPNILKELGSIYNKGHFAKVYEALVKILS